MTGQRTKQEVDELNQALLTQHLICTIHVCKAKWYSKTFCFKANKVFSFSLLPANKRGNDDAPGSATAVGTRLLGARMGVRGLIMFASSAAKPEGVDEKEEKVQAQTHQSHRTNEQNRLKKKEKRKTWCKPLWSFNTLCLLCFSIKGFAWFSKCTN